MNTSNLEQPAPYPMKPIALILSAFLTIAAHGEEKLVSYELKTPAKMIQEMATVFYFDLATFPSLEDPRNEFSKENHEKVLIKHRNKAALFAFMVYLDRRDEPKENMDEIYRRGTTLLLKVVDRESLRNQMKEEQGIMGMFFKNYDPANLDADLEKFLKVHTEGGKPALKEGEVDAPASQNEKPELLPRPE